MCKRRAPHHHKRKGIGGGFRMDVVDNLVSVGAANGETLPECPCHDLIHAGKIPDDRVLKIIAAREGWPSPEALDDYLTWLANVANKWTTPQEVKAKRQELRCLTRE